MIFLKIPKSEVQILFAFTNVLCEMKKIIAILNGTQVWQ